MAPTSGFLVASYRSLDFDSSEDFFRTEDGSRFLATIEEARSIIPKEAVRLPFIQHYQFIELWKLDEE